MTLTDMVTVTDTVTLTDTQMQESLCTLTDIMTILDPSCNHFVNKNIDRYIEYSNITEFM